MKVQTSTNPIKDAKALDAATNLPSSQITAAETIIIVIMVTNMLMQ